MIDLVASDDDLVSLRITLLRGTLKVTNITPKTQEVRLWWFEYVLRRAMKGNANEDVWEEEESSATKEVGENRWRKT